MAVKATSPTFEELVARVAELAARVEAVEQENARLRAELADGSTDGTAGDAMSSERAVDDEESLAEFLKRLRRQPEVIVRRRPPGPFVPYKPTIRVVGGERDVLKLLGRCDDEPDTPFDQE